MAQETGQTAQTALSLRSLTRISGAFLRASSPTKRPPPRPMQGLSSVSKFLERLFPCQDCESSLKIVKWTCSESPPQRLCRVGCAPSPLPEAQALKSTPASAPEREAAPHHPAAQGPSTRRRKEHRTGYQLHRGPARQLAAAATNPQVTRATHTGVCSPRAGETPHSLFPTPEGASRTSGEGQVSAHGFMGDVVRRSHTEDARRLGAGGWRRWEARAWSPPVNTGFLAVSEGLFCFVFPGGTEVCKATKTCRSVGTVLCSSEFHTQPPQASFVYSQCFGVFKAFFRV